MVVLHVVIAFITPYDFHRDEFLYLAMGRHLRLFAMDFPPLIAILAEGQRALFGDAIWSVRLASALAHGALVLLTGLLAARFGGDVFAQLLAMLAAATAPLYLRAGSLFQPVVFDQLWWTLALYALVLIASEAEETTSLRNWIVLGCATGLGLLTKFTILPLGLGILVGMLLTRRAWLRTRGPWVAAVIALVLGSPSWVGQIVLGFPALGQIGDLRATQLERIGYGQFLLELMLMHGPAAFIMAMTGAFVLLASQRFARWRVAAWAALVPALLIMLMRGKPYYVGPVFPLWYAAGAVVVMHALMRVPARAARGALQTGACLLVAAWGIYAYPLSLPVLPPEPTARFAEKLGITAAVQTNRGVVLELPQDYADMLGWQNKVARVADVYHSLPETERADVVIVPDNYGQAGAIDFYGRQYGLPSTVAPMGSYWFWGPGEKPGKVVIKVGGDEEDLAPFCGSVELAARIDERWVVPEEQNLAIWICRQPYRTLQEVWPMFRGQN